MEDLKIEAGATTYCSEVKNDKKEYKKRVIRQRLIIFL
jgi:hypothetical protein